MTITYSLEVSTARLCGFAKLLARWRGSIYRLMYREMLIFAFLYYAIAGFYRFSLPLAHKRLFEQLSVYFREFTSLVPITFVMGFYVYVVVGRWWEQYLAIPWPDKAALQIATYIQGNDEHGRMIRRALARYLNLMSALTFQATSATIRKRFPTMDHLVEAGLMTADERIALDEVVAPHGYWWVPSVWFSQLAMSARKSGRIYDDLHLKSLIDDMMAFRTQCGLIWSYDWISVPLVYTQVVAISVYCFFGACLLGRQYLDQVPDGFDPSHSVDYYVPVFTFFQFFFYMGWLKVAEEMICPFGEDDDDFELNWIIDRNVQVAYVTVDGMHQKHPKLTRDLFWDDLEPDIPYTAASAGHRIDPFMGSTMSMNIATKDMEWLIEPIAEEQLVEKLSGADDDDDEQEGAERSAPRGRRVRPAHSPGAQSARPKFLHRLLAGDSRMSLSGSRFGSNTSVASERSNKESLRSPPPPPGRARRRNSRQLQPDDWQLPGGSVAATDVAGPSAAMPATPFTLIAEVEPLHCPQHSTQDDVGAENIGTEEKPNEASMVHVTIDVTPAPAHIDCKA